MTANPKRTFTVFFSWQTDTRGNTKIIKDELLAQAVYLKEKYGYTVNVMDGTRDIAGMPPIEQVVMDRINDCDVYVCDITPVEEHEISAAPNRRVKQMPNSSVIIELGYALRCMSYHRIIAVARNGNWHDNEMPFDINHMRVGRFTKNECDLRFELEASINHVAKYGRTRPYNDSLWGRIKQHIRMRFDNYAYNRNQLISDLEHTSSKPKATDLSVVAFARRAAEAFPGIRGVEWFEKKSDIRLLLSTFFQTPLQYANSDRGSSDPFWWYRGGSAEHCKSFKLLNGRTVILNNERLNIKRIAVFRDSGRYNREYIYIETNAEKPVGIYTVNEEYRKESIESRGYLWEEYAEFYLAPFITVPIKEEDYDDGHTLKFGRIWATRNRSALRVRYLSPYNILIAAKGSPYNSHEFDRESSEWMNGLLNGTRKFEDFHNFLMSLPKHPFEDKL